MNWSVTFLPDKFAIVVKTGGNFANARFREMVENILGDPRWKPDMHAFFDHRELKLERAGYKEMLQAANTHLKYDDLIGRGRSALLFETSANYGVGRIYESIMDGKAKVKVQVFTDEQEARKWVGLA